MAETSIRKIEELEGADLDTAVALALGYQADGMVWVAEGGTRYLRRSWNPSGQWAIAGPIFDANDIGLRSPTDRMSDDVVPQDWLASCVDAARKTVWVREGPTALVAAMRAFVASRFGWEMSLG